MRDFQTKTNLGGVPDSNTATKMGGGESTSLRTENKTAVSRTGQTLAPQDGTGEKTDQLAKALFINGVAGQSMVDGGSAGVYQLTPITGSAGLAIPDSYDHLSGAVFEFEAVNVNVGASTLDIGQTAGTLLGAKSLTLEGGAALSGGEMVGTVRVIFDLANDRFELITFASAFYRNASNLNAGLLPPARFDNTAHGTRAGGSTHALAIAGGAAGFLSGADQEKIDNAVTSRFKSPAFTLTANTIHTYAHGLTGTPIKAWLAAKCTTPEDGYAVGDWAFALTVFDNNVTTGATNVRVDATNVYFPAGDSVIKVLNQVAAVGADFTNTTPASWDLHLFVEFE